MSAVEPLPTPLSPEPVHDYISTMSDELAALARSVGDSRLAMLLDLAATFAELSAKRS
jgi:hypothetical protein